MRVSIVQRLTGQALEPGCLGFNQESAYTDSVTLSKSFNFLVPPFPNLSSGNNCTSLVLVLEGPS